ESGRPDAERRLHVKQKPWHPAWLLRRIECQSQRFLQQPDDRQRWPTGSGQPSQVTFCTVDIVNVISVGGDRGRAVYVRGTSDRVEILCTAVKTPSTILKAGRLVLVVPKGL